MFLDKILFKYGSSGIFYFYFVDDIKDRRQSGRLIYQENYIQTLKYDNTEEFNFQGGYQGNSADPYFRPGIPAPIKQVIHKKIHKCE